MKPETNAKGALDAAADALSECAEAHEAPIMWPDALAKSAVLGFLRAVAEDDGWPSDEQAAARDMLVKMEAVGV